MDYQTHLHTLGPALSMTYVHQLVSHQVNKLFSKNNEAIAAGNFDGLDELHHFTSGFKAIMTENSH